MIKYSQFNTIQRRKLWKMLQSGLSIAQIAEKLSRHRSTIYPEIKRNRSPEGYLPHTAQQMAQRRKKGRTRKIRCDTPLYHYIRRKLI